MPHVLNTHAEVEVSVFGVKYSKFKLYPRVRNADGGLDIIGWATKNGRGVKVDLYDAHVSCCLNTPLLNHVCIVTFERENRNQVDVKFEIDGESWEYPMRAVEYDDETVHYEIEIDGEWMDTMSTFVGDIFTEEHFPFAENVVLSSMEFGRTDEVYAQMG